MKPMSRVKLIKLLRALGWEGPVSGGKHEFMVKGTRKVRIPNPHKGDISGPMVKEILSQAGITEEELPQ